MGLFTFNNNDSFTFTNANKTGRLGPSLNDCQTVYSGAPFNVNDNSLFNVIDGIQYWTVPVSGKYKIRAAGARGARVDGYTQTDPYAYYPAHGTGANWRDPSNSSDGPKGTAGNGAYTEGEFTFAQGDKIAILVGQRGEDTGNNNTTRSGGGGGASWVCNEARTVLYSVGGGGGGAQAGWRNNTTNDVANWEPGANGGNVNDNGSIPITTNVSYRNLAPGMYNAPNGVGGYYCTNHQSNAGGGAGWGTANGTGAEDDGTGDGHGGSRWLPYYADAAGQPTGGGGGYNSSPSGGQRTYTGGNQNLAEDHFAYLNYNDKKYPPYHYVNSTAHSSPPPSSQSTLGGWTDSQFWAGYQKYYGRPEEPYLSYPNGQGWSPYTARTSSSSLWNSNNRAGTGGISPCANQSLGTGLTAATGRVRRWPDDAVPGAGGAPGLTIHGSDRRDINEPPAWSYRYGNTTTLQVGSEGGFGGGGGNCGSDGGGGGGYTGGAAARVTNGGGRGGTSRNNSSISTPTFGISNLADGQVIITLIEGSISIPSITNTNFNNLSGSDTNPTFSFTSDQTGTIIMNPTTYTVTNTGVTTGSNSMTFNTLQDNTYNNIKFKVSNDAGDSNEIDIPEFIIDTTAPIITAAPDQNLSGINTTPSFTFNSTEAGTIILDPSYGITSTDVGNGSNTITFNTLADGIYDISFQVKDIYNNTSAATISIPQFIIDTTPPSITNTNFNNLSGSDTTPTFSFTSDKTGTININPITYTVSSTIVDVGVNNMTFVTLTPGNYTNIKFTVSDDSGNSIEIDIPDFIIDTTAPIITVAPDQNLSGENKRPSFTFNSTEAGTIILDPSYGITSTDVGNGSNTITFNTLADGTYNISFQVEDIYNNTSATISIPTFTIKIIFDGQRFTSIPTMKVVSGSEAKRNPNPSFGDIRYNTDNSYIEIHHADSNNSSAWRELITNNKSQIDISGKLIVSGDLSLNGNIIAQDVSFNKIGEYNSGNGITILSDTSFNGNVVSNHGDLGFEGKWDISANDQQTAYRFTGNGLDGTEDNPTIYLMRGSKYKFIKNMASHPFRIHNSDNVIYGVPFFTEVDNGDGKIYKFQVPQDISYNELEYYCTSHTSMKGTLKIAGEGGGGGIESGIDVSFGHIDASSISVAGDITTEYIVARGNINVGSSGSSAEITATGEITGFYDSSDKRLKTNITDILDYEHIIKNINGVRFNWNENAVSINPNVDLSKVELGVIAQEIEEYMPEIIKDGIDNYKAVRYEKIIPILIECIKDLHKKIEILQNIQ